MKTVTLESTDYYMIRVKASPLIIKYFKDAFFTQEHFQYLVRPKNKPAFMRQDVRQVKMYIEESSESLLIYAGLIDYIAIVVSQVFRSYEGLTLDYKIRKVPKITLNDKWKEIFSNHPRGFGDWQIEDFQSMLNHPNGILECFTGYGKSEMIMSMIDHVQERTVVLVPDSTIMDEIILRSKIYGINIKNYDWNSQVNVINPVGFMRSNNLNDTSREWLSKVKMVLTDECHHLSADSYRKFWGLLKNVERSYGLSASVDVGEGSELTPGNIKIEDLGPSSSTIIGLSGSVRVKRRLTIPVHVIRIWNPLADPDECRAQDSWQKAFDLTVTKFKTARLIQGILDDMSYVNFFIPIHKKESGFELYQNLTQLGINGIYWTAGELYIDGKHIKGVNELEEIKRVMKEEPRRFIISTRMEGFDVKNLRGIIPLMGTSHRLVLQPVGRAAREDKTYIVLIFDSNSPIVISQSKKRLERVLSEFNVVSNESRKYNLS